MKISSSNAAYQRAQKLRFKAPTYKVMNFAFLQKKRITHACSLVLFDLFFFLQGVIVSKQWFQKIVRGLTQSKTKSSSVLSKGPKDWKETRPHPTPLISLKTFNEGFETTV